MKSYGVLYIELDEHYSVGSGPLAFISSINLGCALGFGKYVLPKVKYKRYCISSVGVPTPYNDDIRYTAPNQTPVLTT